VTLAEESIKYPNEPQIIEEHCIRKKHEPYT